MKKVLLYIFVALMASPFLTRATHIMGGEITWECLSNGQYQFNMKIYRDCNGINLGTSQVIHVLNHPGLSQFTMNLIQQKDISPTCWDTAQQIGCAGGGSGAVEEFIFQSNPMTISGVPPTAGWVFYWSSCCRNFAIDNLSNPGSKGHTLRAIMYPHTVGGIPQDANPCYDASPEFLERPVTISCMGTPFTYNPQAQDAEADSIYYDWDHPLDNLSAPGGTWNPNPIAFATGFSYNNPFPDTAFHPNNVAAVLNDSTGEISYTSFTPGNYVYTVKAEAWKCGQKVAEVYRDYQTVLAACSDTNNAPSITPPFAGGTSFDTTVYVGDTISFAFLTTDLDTLPNGNPQTMTLTASGIQFGAGFISTTSGCAKPPCATLMAPPPLSDTVTLSSTFSWVTDSSHLPIPNGSCGTHSNTYTFVFKVSDDACPIPKQSIATITITVLPKMFANKNITICRGDTAALRAISANNQYSWSPAIGLNNTTVAEPMAAPSSTITYTVSAPGVSAAYNSYQITVFVDTIPTPVLSDTGGTMAVTNNQDYIAFQWYLNGNEITGADTSVYTPMQNGTYSVRVTGVNGCSEHSTGFQVVRVEEYANGGLRVYPNPFGVSARFEWLKQAHSVELQLTDIYGKQVGLYKAKNVKDLTIKRSQLPIGVYFYKLSCDEEHFTGKLLIQ